MATDISLAKVVPFQDARLPQISNVALALISAGLLILSFPSFEYSTLAWVALSPLLVALTRERGFWRAFLLGELTGSVFFYGTCFFLSYSMINYGGLSSPLAYILVAIPCLIAGIFPALFAAITSRCIDRFGWGTIFLAPITWVGTEYLRLVVLRLGWNSLGYSQAYSPNLIQTARFGGVYSVSFLLVLVSAGLVFVSLTQNRIAAIAVILSILGVIIGNREYGRHKIQPITATGPYRVVGIQPNVPLDGELTENGLEAILTHHIDQSEKAVAEFRAAVPDSAVQNTPMIVVWPESPMNLRYSVDLRRRGLVIDFVRRNHVYLIWNTIVERDGKHANNSVVVLTPDGEVASQYDKIYLLPFGEYVPMRDWIPFIGRIPALAGDFTAGTEYRLGTIGSARLGSSICFEATFPQVARMMTRSGATALINVSDDAWFGPTSEARQHLAHAIFRAVENDRELLRVTNSGITARIRGDGVALDLSDVFDVTSRRWQTDLARPTPMTWYTLHGDLLAIACVSLSLIALVASLLKRTRRELWRKTLAAEPEPEEEGKN